MKNYYYISLFLVSILCLVSYNGYAQLTDENTYLINQYFQVNNSTGAGSLLENNKPATSENLSQVNYITLNQVGNYNQIDIRSNVGNSQKVSQFGNSNNYEFINYYNSNISNLNIVQQGNSNSLEIYGENSLIKNISIIQKADFETLIIKNY